MGNFFAEVKRRHLYRVGAGYVVIAWVLAQVVDLLSQVFELPHWFSQPAILILAAGFPVTLVIVWIAESNPQEAIAAAVHSKHTTIDWALFGTMAVLIALAGYRQIALPSVTPARTGVEAAREAATSPASAISLAVLPFANLSGDQSQEFFSDGMTEEITSALAKVPDLRVIARTSAFEFKNKNLNIKTMGEQLGATYLIEGSVRKAGNRLRITAQLIKADDGTHIWAEDYDRDLTDVFEIQEGIARAITVSLRMPLGLNPGERLVNNRSIDPGSYEKYLRAKAIISGRDVQSYAQAESLLTEVVASNAEYAPALESLGILYFLMTGRVANADGPIEEARARIDTLRSKGEAIVQRAIRIDPNFGGAYSVMAVFAWSRAKLLDAEQLYAKSLALDPVAFDGVAGYGLRLAQAGRLKDALAYMERAHAVEPFNPAAARAMVGDLWLNGRNDGAIALAKTLRPNNRAPLLAMIYASMGRFGDAVDALMEIASDPNSNAAKAVRLLGTAPAKAASPAELTRLPQDLAFVNLHAGAPERALEAFERPVDAGYLGGTQASFVWHPSFAPVRKTERFKGLMRKAGFVEYWRAKGWPEYCRPTTGDDFECD